MVAVAKAKELIAKYGLQWSQFTFKSRDRKEYLAREKAERDAFMAAAWARERASWLIREDWKESKQGNPYINFEGYNIAVFPRRGGSWGWRVQVRRGAESWFNPVPYSTAEDAALGSYDFVRSRTRAYSPF